MKHACLCISTWKHRDRDWKWDSFSWSQAGEFLPFFKIIFYGCPAGGGEGGGMGLSELESGN